MRRPAKNRQDSVIGAGAAGGGIGTVVAAVANSLPPTSAMRPLLIVSAPLITVCVSGLWLFIKVVYVDPFVTVRKNRAADTAMDRVLADARSNANRVLSDPNASTEHKKGVQKVVEELERLRMKKITERMQIVSAE